ncbi:MAG: PIG-L family deacetylase [Anaerolineae bacterium]|nr:PIG-L family deacetylase [Anaerolineae bacterium]
MSIDRKTILAVLAHPDDESFGMGGTLALYASRGVDVHLVCATKGEAGDVDPEYMQGFDTVADCRVAELNCAADHLGLAGVHFLGYRDSGMAGSDQNHHDEALASQPVEQVAARIAQYIRQLRPQVVLTFDPVGGYHHPDHIAINKAAELAFHMAGDPTFNTDDLPPHKPEMLYYQIFPRKALRLVVRALHLAGRDPSKFGRNQDIDLTVLAGDEEFPIHARISYRRVIAQKKAADRCHASQLDWGASSTMYAIFERFTPARDYYMRAYPPVNGNHTVKDLFAD